MFDSVLGRGVTPKSRFGSGAVVSVLLHVGLLAFALWISTRPPAKEEKDVSVVLKVAPPPPPPPHLEESGSLRKFGAGDDFRMGCRPTCPFIIFIELEL